MCLWFSHLDDTLLFGGMWREVQILTLEEQCFILGYSNLLPDKGGYFGERLLAEELPIEEPLYLILTPCFPGLTY